MKRLIKFYNRYTNDGAKFSNCSTEYEVLPVLVDDDASFLELTKYAALNNINLLDECYEAGPKKYGFGSNVVTHAVKLTEIKSNYKDENLPYWLGFITLNEKSSLKAKKLINNKITKKESYKIINMQEYDIHDFGQHVDGGNCLVIDSWNFFHELPLLGYPLDSLYKALDIDEYHGFSDATYRCDECGVFDDRDDGYTYNHRIVEDCGQLGVNCGCYDEYAESNYDEYVGNHKKCLELNIAEKLQNDKKLEFLERFIGGMTDGRGGYYDGESTREGQPENILNEYKEKYPNDSFLFTHDESGQFQTYFSIWRVL